MEEKLVLALVFFKLIRLHVVLNVDSFFDLITANSNEWHKNKYSSPVNDSVNEWDGGLSVYGVSKNNDVSVIIEYKMIDCLDLKWSGCIDIAHVIHGCLHNFLLVGWDIIV